MSQQNRLTSRRDLLMQGAAIGAAAWLPRIVSAGPPSSIAPGATSESVVGLLYKSLTPEQKKSVCFDWGFERGEQGLLRTRLQNNWHITKPEIRSDFYTPEQRDMIRAIFEGMVQPEWVKKFDQQLKDDCGGFGVAQNIAIFGSPEKPGEKFEFVLTGRHMTLRCDGHSAEHVAFGGPILYGHAAKGHYEKKDHEGNVFWQQALEANKLYQMLDGKHRDLALIKQGMPAEDRVEFHGKGGPLPGVPVTEFSADQKEHLQGILKLLIEPYRQGDRDDVLKCLKTQGGLDACRLAFYEEGDLGKDGVWDNWRLEGPSFVWYFRGKPHVHVWVNVADDPSVKLNAHEDSVM
jgi:hypothetical protein